MKRWIAALLILSCLMSLMPMTATATQETRQQDGKLIAITFDDGPSNHTKRLLDGLAKRNVKATFFLIGQKINTYSVTVRRIFNEGHQIAQHTYDHPTLTTQSDSQVKWQLQRTDELIDNCLGMNLDYCLRPPYGDCNSRVLSLIDCPAIMWSIDSLDWQLLDAYKVRDRIVSNAFDGAIILAHDTMGTTVDGALMAIDILLERGYEFVTVSELYRRRGMELQDGQRHYSRKPNGTDLGPIAAPEVSATPVYGGYEITLKAQPGTKIYYSTDGSAPVTLYSGKFTLIGGQELKAFACYTINEGRSETVTSNVNAGSLKPLNLRSENGKFLIDNPNAGVDVRYTKDGSAPTANSALYTNGIGWFDGTLTYCAMGSGVGSAAKSYYVSARGSIFLDVKPQDWYFKEMDWAASQGLLKGTQPYIFEPETGLTRAMFVTLLYRLMGNLGYQTGNSQSAGFRDVAAGSWYEAAVNWAAENGIVRGDGNGKFRPDAAITREEMCTIMDRLLGFLNYEVRTTEISFKDKGKISPWAYESVCHLVGLGIIRGMGNNTFAPKNTATRAEAATVLLRFYNAIK